MLNSPVIVATAYGFPHVLLMSWDKALQANVVSLRPETTVIPGLVVLSHNESSEASFWYNPGMAWQTEQEKYARTTKKPRVKGHTHVRAGETQITRRRGVKGENRQNKVLCPSQMHSNMALSVFVLALLRNLLRTNNLFCPLTLWKPRTQST